MAIFRANAKVLEPDDPMRIYQAGLRTCPGQPGLLLADVPRRTGGLYETTTPLAPRLRDDIREAARVSRTREHRPTLATIMPDGTVITGDAFPAPPAPTP